MDRMAKMASNVSSCWWDTASVSYILLRRTSNNAPHASGGSCTCHIWAQTGRMKRFSQHHESYVLSRCLPHHCRDGFSVVPFPFLLVYYCYFFKPLWDFSIQIIIY